MRPIATKYTNFDRTGGPGYVTSPSCQLWTGPNIVKEISKRDRDKRELNLGAIGAKAWQSLLRSL